jgi:hypothetical protein
MAGKLGDRPVDDVEWANTSSDENDHDYLNQQDSRMEKTEFAVYPMVHP